MSQYTQQHSTWLAARAADVTSDDLWLHYYGVGGDLDAFELDAYLNGVYELPVTDRNLIAIALNELIDELPQRPRAEYEKTPRPDAEDLPVEFQHLWLPE